MFFYFFILNEMTLHINYTNIFLYSVYWMKKYLLHAARVKHDKYDREMEP